MRSGTEAGFTLRTFVLAGDKPADQGPRGQLRGAARQPPEGVEQLSREKGTARHASLPLGFHRFRQFLKGETTFFIVASGLGVKGTQHQEAFENITAPV